MLANTEQLVSCREMVLFVTECYAYVLTLSSFTSKTSVVDDARVIFDALSRLKTPRTAPFFGCAGELFALIPSAAAAIRYLDHEPRTNEQTQQDDPSLTTNLRSRAVLDKCADLYLPSGDKTSPLLSALNGDLTGLPPLFVPIEGNETLLDDARALALKAKEANVPVELKIYDRQFHVFQIFASRMAEAQRAIDDIGRFVLSHIP
ncbi:hypothetical protein Z517_04932 [Fonsecaea pedrosoi CBS 271.37]|uniref:Alpha/beta hydrolase fold-3 domain-containing protein n=1 Tax=Fonsecaea pedrosoi CBS 271.37 TaxID=1442368 RepID=A0A0D2DVS7_9EURO|nr:uncharacterized protein Z517_04932 [Fonsecaea pedrosoi CBS 271.37]KIW81906.1 hypothetical protein Z517_04932 [Fonsecaea pedrosoi CBS 271.37]